ncbi:MAG TPA: hypothetical protein VK913_03505, partial [Erythrobacter sp.]|nr:hypothetical protein [Erythrobacter sp.]
MTSKDRQWSLPASADYAEAAPSLSLGAPRTLVADEPAASEDPAHNEGTAARQPADKPSQAQREASPTAPAHQDRLLDIAEPDPVDATWQARMSGQYKPVEQPLSEGQSALGHDIFDRMGTSRQQAMAFSLGRFDVDEHLRALETALALDARLASGGSAEIADEPKTMGDFDLLAEIASLAAASTPAPAPVTAIVPEMQEVARNSTEETPSASGQPH